MDKPKKPKRLKPRRLRGFRDIVAADVRARDQMIATIRRVYERYGFIPLETPAMEYVEVLGKFLPEADQPDGGIFAMLDEDEEWIALRYDLTAPLSRFFAMNSMLPRPFRRYQVGPVYRVEKPGPDRFREFYQFDFDTVGAPSMLADAECCMIMCDTLEALGIERGDYIVRMSNRKVLSGVLERVGQIRAIDDNTQLNILRTMDKLDRLGLPAVRQLLGAGRKDGSGAFTDGLDLADDQIKLIVEFLSIKCETRAAVCDAMAQLLGDSTIGMDGVTELREIDQALTGAGYCEDRIETDVTIVRGLAYYTGPVYEAVLTFEVVDEKGAKRQFGSVFGGGRYDNLVQRFTGEKVPATGASIGVDRLLAALSLLGKTESRSATAEVLVTRLDKSLSDEYQRLATELRASGINTEMFLGKQNIGKQFKYASDTGKTVAIIMGEDERQAGEVSIKDLRLGIELSKEVGGDRKRWLEEQPAQFTVKRDNLVQSIQQLLDRYTQ